MNVKLSSYFLACLLILISCSDKKQSNENKEIIIKKDFTKLNFENLLAYYFFEIDSSNEDSVINSLNDSLIYFKNYKFTTTEAIDTISGKIELTFESYQDDPYTISCIWTRNIFQYSFINDDTTLINKEFKKDNKVSINSIKNFINHPINADDAEEFPQFKRKFIDELNDTVVSKQFFYIDCQFFTDTSVSITNWKTVKPFVKNIHSAYKEVRDEAAIKLWGLKFEMLNFKQKSAITQLHPIRILINPNKQYFKPPPNFPLPASN
jgi:hypothetical protein